MAITYQGAGAAAANTVAATTLNVAYPASIAANDVLVLSVTTNSTTAATTPGGWTGPAGATGAGTGGSPAFRMAYTLATGSESGTLAVTTPSATSQGWMFLLRGVNTANPIDVTTTAFSTTGATAYNIPTVTTTMTGVALVYCGAGNSSAGSWTPPTVPAAFTEVYDVITASPKSTGGYLIWSGSGATGTVNLVSSASVRGAAGMLAFRPAVPTFAPAPQNPMYRAMLPILTR